MDPSKPRVLAILPGIMPSTLMDVVKPLIALQAAGHIDLRVALENYPVKSSVHWANLVVFCRNTEPRYQYILRDIVNNQIPYIYDLDDNFFEAPLDTEEGQYYRDPERIRLLNQYLKMASLVRVYSKHLLDQVKQFGTHVQIVVPPLDLNTLHHTPKKNSNNRVKIVYATSRRDDRLSSIFSPALLRILQEYPQQVEVYFWGFRPPIFQSCSNTHFRRYTPNYDKFMRQFSSMGFEIGLAPLANDIFHLSKTNNKFREYSACGIAGIYSNVDVYADCIENGKTGLLVSNEPENWFSAMVALIQDADLRSSMGQAAKMEVEQLYSSERFNDEWWKQIQIALSNSHSTKPEDKQSPEIAYKSPNQRNINVPKIWLEKIKRATKTTGNLQKLLVNSQLHLINLWWLFKLNYFKRL